MGIDIAKNAFHVVGLDRRGAIVLRHRWSRGQGRSTTCEHAAVPDRDGGLRWRPSPEPQTATTRSRCAIDAGEIRAALFEGAEKRLSRRRSNRRGGAAPDDEIRRPKTADQLDLQALHRVGERLVGQRTGIINQIRAFLLEHGIAVRQGLRFLRAELPIIIATRSDVLSPRMLRVIEELMADWRRLDERIEGLCQEIEAFVRQDPSCERLMTVPSIGPIISSAMVAAIGNGVVFTKGRDFGTWLGLVPKQSRLETARSGCDIATWQSYLQALFVQAA
jgi:transposase